MVNVFPNVHNRITCPCCFERFPLQETHFRCVNPSCSGRGYDNEYSLVRGLGRTIMGRVLIPKKTRITLSFTASHEALCSACQVISNTRLCPKCHYTLAPNIEKSEQKVIAIIGGRATGKTHYIAALIHHLTHAVGPNFAITAIPLGDESQKRWIQDFYTPLFELHTVLQPTQPAAINSQVKIPLIFRLHIGKGHQSHILNLSFFDTAGEDMTNNDTLSTYSKYICGADGIIFLLDPLQMSGIRQKMDATQLPGSDPSAAPDNIVRALRELFERVNHIGPHQKIKIPIAFTLSKTDAIAAILDDPGSPLFQSSNHIGTLGLNDIQSLHTDIDHRLQDWLSPNFCNYIAENFANYNYFGVSSLGNQPDAQGYIDNISPRRVEEPFLWLLYRNNLIKGRN